MSLNKNKLKGMTCSLSLNRLIVLPPIRLNDTPSILKISSYPKRIELIFILYFFQLTQCTLRDYVFWQDIGNVQRKLGDDGRLTTTLLAIFSLMFFPLV